MISKILPSYLGRWFSFDFGRILRLWVQKSSFEINWPLTWNLVLNPYWYLLIFYSRSAMILRPSLVYPRPAVLNASNICGPTSRKKTSKTRTTRPFSPRIRRWPRFSARTVSEARVCPSILAHTFLTSTIEKYV